MTHVYVQANAEYGRQALPVIQCSFAIEALGRLHGLMRNLRSWLGIMRLGAERRLHRNSQVHLNLSFLALETL
jgi:hypothetical protein